MLVQVYDDSFASWNRSAMAEFRREDVLFEVFSYVRDALGADVEIEIDRGVGVARAFAPGKRRSKGVVAFNPDAFIFVGLDENLVQLRGRIVAVHELAHFMSSFHRSQKAELFCDRMSGGGARIFGMSAKTGIDLLQWLPGLNEHPPGVERARAFVEGWNAPDALLQNLSAWKERESQRKVVSTVLVAGAIGLLAWSVLKKNARKSA